VRGTKRVYGFVSQQIKEHIPEAVVSQEKGTLYDIYKVFKISNNIFYININEYEGTYNVGDKLSCVLKNGKDDDVIIKEIYENCIVMDKDIPNEDVIFINGKNVDDFHTLDKNYIYTLNVSATQELHKIIMEQKNEITDLKERLVRLEAYILGNILFLKMNVI
jgi:hypothetical protein